MSELRPVASSNLAAVSWADEVLTVKFQSGHEYQFYGVPKTVYRGLLRAPSKGKYFWKRVGKKYEYSRKEYTLKHPGHADQSVHGNWARPRLRFISGSSRLAAKFTLVNNSFTVRNREVDAGIRLASKVHSVPPQMNNIKVLTVEGDDGGEYDPRYRSIRVSSNFPAPRVVAIHETGHAIAEEVFGSVNDPFKSPKGQELYQEIKKSQSFSEWSQGVVRRFGFPMKIADSDSPTVNYITKKGELFARAYTQYIATKTGNLQLHMELGKIEGSVPHWGKDEFKPIEKAFDALFRERGLK